MNVTQVQYALGQQPPVLHLPLRDEQNPRDRRIADLVRDIRSCPTLSAEEKKLATRASRLPAEKAATYIFLKIIGPALEASTPGIENLFDRANALFEEQGDPDAFLEDELNMVIAQAVEDVEADLDQWQERLAGQVEQAMETRESQALAAQNEVQSVVNALHATAEAAIALADHLDRQEASVMRQLDRVDNVLAQRRKKNGL